MKKKKIDHLFFLVYNYFYKNGNYKNGIFTKFYPWHYTIFVLSLGSVFWTILFFSIGTFYLGNKFVNSSSAPVFIACYFLYFSFYYSYFIKKNRYQEIYDEFKNTIYVEKIESIVAVVVLIILPLILIILFSLIWHNLI